MFGAILPGQAKVTEAVYDHIDAGKFTQQYAAQYREKYGPPDIRPLQFNFRKPPSGDVVEDTMRTLDDLARSGRALMVGNVPIYGGPEGGLTAVQGLQQGLAQSLQMVMQGAAFGMLPLGGIGWVAGMSAAGSYGAGFATLYVGLSAAGAGVGAWWG